MESQKGATEQSSAELAPTEQAPAGRAVTLPPRPDLSNGHDPTALGAQGTIEVEIRDLCLSYDGATQVLKHINMDIAKGQVTAFIGPSGCGKSTLLRCLNRLNDLVDGCTTAAVSSWVASKFWIKRLTSPRCANGSAWCSRSRTPFPRPSMKMWPTGRGCSVSATSAAG